LNDPHLFFLLAKALRAVVALSSSLFVPSTMPDPACVITALLFWLEAQHHADVCRRGVLYAGSLLCLVFLLESPWLALIGENEKRAEFAEKKRTEKSSRRLVLSRTLPATHCRFDA